MIFKLAIREIINYKKFSLIFILNMGLGLFGFSLLHTFKNALDKNIEGRSKEMLKGDLSFSSRNDISDEERAQVFGYLKDKIESYSYNIDIYSMVRAVHNRGELSVKLAQISAIDEFYPLYGEIKEINNTSRSEFSSSKNVWIEEKLGEDLSLKIGDDLAIGEGTYKVQGIIEKDSSFSFNALSLAPKLYMPLNYIKDTKLIGSGSIVRYSYYFKFYQDLKTSPEEIKKHLGTILKDPALKISLPSDHDEQVGRVLGYVTDYLGLVSLIALFLAGIGGSYLFQGFLFKRFKEIGILKSLGLSKIKIFFLYCLELFFLSVSASFVSLLFILFLLPLISPLVNSEFSLNLELVLNLKTVFLVFLISFLNVFFICTPVLLKILEAETYLLFSDVSHFRFNFKTKEILLFIPLLVFYLILSIYEANSFRVGGAFYLSLLFAVLLLSFIFPFFMKANEKILRNKKLLLPFKMALRNLARNPLSSTMSFLSLAMGILLLNIIIQFETSLRGELSFSNSSKPELFLFDIQDEQVADLKSLIHTFSGEILHLAPMIGARISKINGEAFTRKENLSTFRTREEEVESNFRNRSVNLSYSSKLNSSEKIVLGCAFSDCKISDVPFISLEERYAKRLGLKIGDKLAFDILGVEVEGIVVNLRQVRWTNFIPNFFIVFNDGVLNDAPKTYLLALSQGSPKLQNELVKKFPNVSMVNVKLVITEALSLFSLMTKAIIVMATLCLLVGFFVIYSIMNHELQRKAYEFSLLKTLGLSFLKIQGSVVIEYAILVILALLFGSSISLILGFILSQIFFDGVWSKDLCLTIQVSLSIFSLTVLISYSVSLFILKKSASRFLFSEAK